MTLVGERVQRVKDGIIAGVTGWHAALLALPFWFAPPAGAAEDLQSAAKELGRKTASAVGREPVAVNWRNLSSLGSAALAQARGSFEAALRESGARAGEARAVEAQVTLSENAASYLLVEELRKGDDRQVWIASWKRAPRGRRSGGGDREAPVVGAGGADSRRGSVARRAAGADAGGAGAGRCRARALPMRGAEPWPRDLRGRLRVNGGGLRRSCRACRAAAREPLALSCKASDEPWTLESGRALLLASFAANRNYFDGRVVTQAGLRKTVGAFYSAAAVDGAWMLAMLDGRATFFDAAMEPAGSAGQWGSDVAAVGCAMRRVAGGAGVAAG